MTVLKIKMTTPTPPAVQQRIDALLDAVANRMCYLRDRWQDERAYEDFADYDAAMRAAVESSGCAEGVRVLRTSKGSFGFVFTVDGAPAGATYRIAATSRNVGWTRLS